CSGVYAHGYRPKLLSRSQGRFVYAGIAFSITTRSFGECGGLPLTRQARAEGDLLFGTLTATAQRSRGRESSGGRRKWVVTGGWVLVLLDADDDCPAEKGREVERRAAEVVPYRRISVVFANREYEAWFLAGAASLNGFRGFQVGEDGGVDAESVRNAKGWMT